MADLPSGGLRVKAILLRLGKTGKDFFGIKSTPHLLRYTKKTLSKKHKGYSFGPTRNADMKSACAFAMTQIHGCFSLLFTIKRHSQLSPQA